LISGTTTDESGAFDLTANTADSIQIRIQYIGFNPFDTIIRANQQNSKYSFVFSLTPQSFVLREVQVNADKTTSTVHIDKQSFNAAKLGNSTSGTGLDVIQHLPSVTVNSEGQILMRGNAEFLVTINGKFTNQSPADVLSMLPANTIENIEIISSPSASLDAEGKAGIINIVTKRNLNKGWGVVINGNLSNINPDRYGSDLTYYNSSLKFNSYITLNYRQYNIGGYRKGALRTIFQDTITYSPSFGERPTKDKTYGIRAGTGYSINKTATLNAGVYYGYKESDRTAELHYTQYADSQQPLNLYHDFGGSVPENLFYNQNVFVRTGKFFTSSTDFTKSFSNKNKLSLLAIYEYSILGGPLTNQNTDEINKDLLLKERSDENSPLNAWRLQADYSFFINELSSLETGYKWNTVHHEGHFDFERLNLNTSIWENDPEFNDDLDLTQTINAGYVQLNGKYKQIKYNVGLRAEYMYRQLSHLQGDETIKLTQLDLFPSFQVFWNLKKAQILKLAYSKRIDRPTTKALSPFKNHRHSEAIWIGDPHLLPEISHNIELSYAKTYNKSSLSLTAYYKYTSNVIFRTNESYNRITLLTLLTNAGNSNSTGIEMITEKELTKWLHLYLSANAYYFTIGDIKNSTVNSANSVNYNWNINMSIHLFPKLNVQWDATYVSKTITAQGNDTRLFLSNIGLKYSLNKNITFDLLFQNIFNTNIQTITTYTDKFYSPIEYTKYDRIVQLSFSMLLNEKGKSNKTLKTEYGEKDF
jgi:outer membrane receptor protein involved in Fe transport